jgi:hypothetical protein
VLWIRVCSFFSETQVLECCMFYSWTWVGRKLQQRGGICLQLFGNQHCWSQGKEPGQLKKKTSFYLQKSGRNQDRELACEALD